MTLKTSETRNSLQKLLKSLVLHGCTPSIYLRGRFWRAHINACGNFWRDDTDPLKALQKAERAWVKAGSPMDGTAAK